MKYIKPFFRNLFIVCLYLFVFSLCLFIAAAPILWATKAFGETGGVITSIIVIILGLVAAYTFADESDVWG